MVLTLLVAGGSDLGSDPQAQIRVRVDEQGRTVLSNEGSTVVRPRSQARVLRPAADVDEAIARHAALQELDEKLVRAVVHAESAFNPRAVSHKGAMGLMQLMPATAAALQVEDPYDVESNVRGGTEYLRSMLDLFGQDLELALAAYNAGPNAVQQYGGIPPYRETQRYVEKILRDYRGDPSYSVSGAVSAPRQGRKVFLRRDGQGRLLMTTSPR